MWAGQNPDQLKGIKRNEVHLACLKFWLFSSIFFSLPYIRRLMENIPNFKYSLCWSKSQLCAMQPEVIKVERSLTVWFQSLYLWDYTILCSNDAFCLSFSLVSIEYTELF